MENNETSNNKQPRENDVLSDIWHTQLYKILWKNNESSKNDQEEHNLPNYVKSSRKQEAKGEG